MAKVTETEETQFKSLNDFAFAFTDYWIAEDVFEGVESAGLP